MKLMNTLTTRKGFTLIELLIVIAIIAILATAVILLLNPAALLAQARDSQRISDLDTMKSAIALWQSTTGASLGGSASACYFYNPVSPAVSPAANCDGRHVGRTTTANTSTAIDGTGWIFGPDFRTTPGGSPLSVLPRDPKPDSTHFYSYATDGVGQYEIDANMESSRYAQGGSDDAESTDGGNIPGVREVGNVTSLAY